MSTLNPALQNVSLARAAMDPEFEGMIQNKSTLTELQTVIEKSPALAVAMRDSMSPVIAQLAQRFTQMKLKEEPGKCATAVSDGEIDRHFELLHFIDPALSQNNLTAKALNTCPSLKKFLDTHCHSSHYVFQIRKCLDPSCYYCLQHPVKMDKEKFRELSLLPLPLLDNTKEHYHPTTLLESSMAVHQPRKSILHCSSQKIRKLLKQTQTIKHCLTAAKLGLSFTARSVSSPDVFIQLKIEPKRKDPSRYSCRGKNIHLWCEKLLMLGCQ